MKITLKGEPKSTNHIYKYSKKSGMYMTSKGRKLKEDYQKQLQAQFRGDLLECMLKLDIKIFYRTKYKRDWDNCLKVLMDALEGMIIKDDVQIQDARVRKYYTDADMGKVEIGFTKLIPEEGEEVNWYLKR